MSFAYTMQEVIKLGNDSKEFLFESTSKEPLFTFNGFLETPKILSKCVTLDCNKSKSPIFFSSENDDYFCRSPWNLESDEYCSGNPSTVSTSISSECSPDSITDNLTDIPLKAVKSKQLNGTTSHENGKRNSSVLNSPNNGTKCFKFEDKFSTIIKPIEIKLNNVSKTLNNSTDSLRPLLNGKLEKNSNTTISKENDDSNGFCETFNTSSNTSNFQQLNGKFSGKLKEIPPTNLKTMELSQKAGSSKSNNINPTFIGPLMPSNFAQANASSSCEPNKFKNSLKPNLNEATVNRSSSLPLNTSPLKTTPSPLQNKRKRILSERGERELQFPDIDCRIFKQSWKGCNLVKSKPCGVGLYNYSNDCFLNSVLQSIVHTAPLARYIIESHECNNKNACISCSLATHIKRSINSSGAFEAQWIQKYLSKIFPSHRRGHQEDAHEMLTLLLCALEPVPTQQNGIKKMPSSSTPIEQIFGGNLRNQIVCGACGTIHTNYEKIREINLAITRNNNCYQGTNISDLLQDFFKPEQLQLFTCKNCNSKRTATRHTSILRAPSVLIIQLKRFNLFGGKNRTNVSPNIAIDLKKFMYDNGDMNKDESITHKESTAYKLNGIIQHIGGGVNSGHYNCAWRGFDDQTWYMFDDSLTYKMENREIHNMEPYILFYSKIPIEKLQNTQQNSNSVFKRKYSNGGNSTFGSFGGGSFSKTFIKPLTSYKS